MSRRVSKRSAKQGLSDKLHPSDAFGVQSRWSSLLVERERLEGEIQYAKMFLEHIRKDVAGWDEFPPARQLHGRGVAVKSKSGTVRAALDKHALEQSLLMWLDGLHARLDQVNAAAEKLLAEGEQQSEAPEESLFTLLRGAG